MMDLGFSHVLCFLRKPQAKSTRMPVFAKGPILKKKKKKKHPSRKLEWQPIIENNLAITQPGFVAARTIRSHYKSLKLWFLWVFLFVYKNYSLPLPVPRLPTYFPFQTKTEYPQFANLENKAVLLLQDIPDFSLGVISVKDDTGNSRCLDQDPLCF